MRKKKRSLKASYDFGFEWLPVNAAGEVDAEALLDLNKWYYDQEVKIRNEFIIEVGKVMNDGQKSSACEGFYEV